MKIKIIFYIFIFSSLRVFCKIFCYIEFELMFFENCYKAFRNFIILSVCVLLFKICFIVGLFFIFRV